MRPTIDRFALLILLTLLLVGCDPAPSSPAASATPDETAKPARELQWDELMPADFAPEALFEGVDIASLVDDDPQAIALMEKLRKLWDEAPVVETLDGERVRLPGFAIPLEMDGEAVTQFLLVPFYGACIHVPPPPANQTVLVEAAGELRVVIRQAFDTVWVTGQLAAKPTDTGLAKAGYTLTASAVQPYP
jgi:uncharacterized protein